MAHESLDDIPGGTTAIDKRRRRIATEGLRDTTRRARTTLSRLATRSTGPSRRTPRFTTTGCGGKTAAMAYRLGLVGRMTIVLATANARRRIIPPKTCSSARSLWRWRKPVRLLTGHVTRTRRVKGLDMEWPSFVPSLPRFGSLTWPFEVMFVSSKVI